MSTVPRCMSIDKRSEIRHLTSVQWYNSDRFRTFQINRSTTTHHQNSTYRLRYWSIITMQSTAPLYLLCLLVLQVIILSDGSEQSLFKPLFSFLAAYTRCGIDDFTYPKCGSRRESTPCCSPFTCTADGPFVASPLNWCYRRDEDQFR